VKGAKCAEIGKNAQTRRRVVNQIVHFEVGNGGPESEQWWGKIWRGVKISKAGLNRFGALKEYWCARSIRRKPIESQSSNGRAKRNFQMRRSWGDLGLKGPGENEGSLIKGLMKSPKGEKVPWPLGVAI